MCKEIGGECARKEVELGKLSVHHNIADQPSIIATTLLGVGRMEILKLNLDLVLDGLTAQEEEVLVHIKEKYFSKMTNAENSWDGKEVEEYKKAIKAEK